VVAGLDAVLGGSTGDAVSVCVQYSYLAYPVASGQTVTAPTKDGTDALIEAVFAMRPSA